MKYILFSLFIAIMVSCGKVQNHQLAQKEADFIVENLTDYDKIKSKLPERYFDPIQTQNFIRNIKDNCDWNNKRGKFVDYFTMGNISGTDQTAFIYEYFLACDSLRVILIYNMPDGSPELIKIHLEPLETKCEMIIDPSKQLIPQ